MATRRRGAKTRFLSHADAVDVVQPRKAGEKRRRDAGPTGVTTTAPETTTAPPHAVAPQPVALPDATGACASAQVGISREEAEERARVEIYVMLTRRKVEASSRIRYPWTPVEDQELERLHGVFSRETTTRTLYIVVWLCQTSRCNLLRFAGLLWVRILVAGWQIFKVHSRTNTDLRDRWRHLLLVAAKAPEGALESVFGSSSDEARVGTLLTRDTTCTCGARGGGDALPGR